MSKSISLLAIITVLGMYVLSSCHTDKEKHHDGNHATACADTTLTPAQMLGKKLFFDTGLSNPPGKSCAGCHTPGIGFTDPEGLPVSRGAVKEKFGHRNSLSVAYAAYTPYFHYDSADETYVGGLFWDGRAKTLSEQATNPLLNHVEMNNANKEVVVKHVINSDYKELFRYVYGPNALKNADEAFEDISEAIEEYEETKEISPFSSKFDYYVRGLVKLSDAEMRGLKLFNAPEKGNCAACHPSMADANAGVILFTDFTYDNIGVPVNPKVGELCRDSSCDIGLGAILHDKAQNGKFKVPTLRNIALTAPYFHNGVVKTLKEAVQFYNERDSGKFGKPETEDNLNKEDLGNLKLSEQEVNDIVSFMQTLTDGYNLNKAK
jgi:cytochrome c peroxidase